MELKTACENGRLTVFLSGEIDHHTAREWREQIDAAVGRGRVHELRLDFGGITFMDSSGVGLIMGRYRLIKGQNGRLIVCHASEALDRMMKLAGLDCLPIWEEETVCETHQ